MKQRSRPAPPRGSDILKSTSFVFLVALQLVKMVMELSNIRSLKCNYFVLHVLMFVKYVVNNSQYS